MKFLPSVKLRTFILFFAAFILVAGISYRLGEKQGSRGATSLSNKPIINSATPESANIDFSLFWDVWQRLHTSYIDAANIDTQKMIWGAITGMVSSLDDPYTTFLPPKENSQFKEDIGGSFQGIGAQLGNKDSHIVIVAPLKGSPAEKAGLKAFDWVIKVDTEDTTGWTLTQAVNKIRGKKGTKVTLNILHEKAEKPEDITIIRDEIVVPSVEYWIKTPGEVTEIAQATVAAELKTNQSRIAYILLSRFGDRTNDEWLKAVSEITAEIKTGRVKGFILDLRNNPGGYLDGAVFIASEFIKSGIVVTQTNSDGTKQDYQVDRKGSLYDVPMIVLVNKGSASAAEIVAGALRDYKRARIVGETTFGKGSVQTPEELKGGAGLHITTGKWLLPKGDWIHKKGITPDVEVVLNGDEKTDIQMAKAIELLLQ